jgi:hypothetical protein
VVRWENSVSRFARWQPPQRAFVVLAFLVSVVTLAKGCAREVHPYALSQYTYTYEHGFLIRGLPGELVRMVCAERAGCIETGAEVIGMLALFGVVAVLPFVVKGQSWTRASLLALALAASGPALVSLGATRGYHDALTLLIGLLAYHLYRRDRLLLAVACFLVALLVHELVAFFVLPLFLLEPSLFRFRTWSRRVAARAAVVAALGAAALGVVHFGQADREQKRAIEAALKRNASEHQQGFRAYRAFGVTAATKLAPVTTNNARDLDQRRYRRYWRTPLLLALAVLALSLWKRSFAELPLWLVICAAPHAIYLVAWDVDRMLSLTGLTALFVLVEVLRHHRIERAPLLVVLPVLAVTLWQLAEPYSQLTRRYARGDLWIAPKSR